MTASHARAGLGTGSWDDLFDFLDPARQRKSGPDRDALAEGKCLEIRRKLTCYFSARGCPEAEDLAVETLLRVAGKCREVDASGYTDRTGYFYGVARNVLHEWQRGASADLEGRESFRAELVRLPIPDAHAWDEKERVQRYLSLCLSQLTGRSRELILGYYREDGGAKIAHHKVLAAEFGRSVNSLRIEVHRIRKALRDCLFEHLRGGRAAPAVGHAG